MNVACFDSEEKIQFASIVYEKGLENEAESLRQEINRELRNFIHPVESNEKSHYRNYNLLTRQSALFQHQSWLDKNWHKYQKYFAAPSEINPNLIQPRLALVEKQSERDIFRLARLFWSLPYSRGYGRRLDYLLWDDSNCKIIGILGLQSPPLSLPARDRKFNIPRDRKIEIVNQTMDAYTLGAVPPYSDLLGGKLLVLAASSQDVRKDYESRYEGKVTKMLNRVLPASLIAVTTLSAFGRSSLYNRVSKNFDGKQNQWAAISLGPCDGWGTCHFSDDMYRQIKDFHKMLFPEKQITGFGTGPKIRQQVIKRVVHILRLPDSLMRHNIKREVFIIPHVSNLEAFLGGLEENPLYNDEPFANLVTYWKDRYCLPRSKIRCSIEGKDTIAQSLGLK